MKRLLITRSRHDPGNKCLYAYSKEVIEEATAGGWNVIKSEDENNTAQSVQSKLFGVSINLALFHGHGTPDSIHGYNDEVLIDLKSAKLLSKTIVYASSCSTVKNLGKQAVIDGCKAFIGYDGLFTIPQIDEYLSTPLRDPSAKPVLNASNTVSKLLLKGSSVETAVRASKTNASKTMLKMLESEEPYDKGALSALFENYLNLTFQGNAQACVK